MEIIEFIKDEFSKPSLMLYKYRGCPIQNLISRDSNTATDITLSTNTNECAQLTFSLPMTKDRKLDHSSNELLIYFSGIFFIIKDVDIDDSSSHTIKITADEISTSLKGIYCEAISKIASTPKEIYDAIILSTNFTDIGYTWLGTDVASGITGHLIVDSETSCYENLVSLASAFGGTVEFSYNSSGDGFIYIRSNPISTGKFIKKDIDMTTLTITSSSKEIYTRLYPTGSTNTEGVVLDVQSVNNGSTMLEDFSFYKAKGVPDEIIAKYPQYRQFKTYSDTTITDANDLLTYGKRELAKYSRPQFTAECTMLDLACYVDSPIEHPRINTMLKCIDKSINFIFDCQITGVERDYNNPLSTKLTISNVIPYSTSFQSLQATTDTVSKVISTNASTGQVSVNTNYLQGNIDALKTSLIGTVDLTTPTSSQSTLAILFEDKRIGYPTYGAMGFGTKGLCIANSLKVDGTWDWKTFGDVNGFNASLIKTGILKDLDDNFSLNLTDGETKVPTQILGTSSKQIANTEFVMNAIANLVDSSPSTLNTLNELAQALGDDPNFATTIMNMLSLKTNNTDETRTTNDKTVTGAINELNARQNIVISTITRAITVGIGNITTTITGLGLNPIVVTNGDYELNTAQILGVKNINVDTIIIYYSNGIDGNCKFNYTYSK